MLKYPKWRHISVMDYYKKTSYGQYSGQKFFILSPFFIGTIKSSVNLIYFSDGETLSPSSPAVCATSGSPARTGDISDECSSFRIYGNRYKRLVTHFWNTILLQLIPTTKLIRKISRNLYVIFSCRWGKHPVGLTTFISAPKYYFRFVWLVR